MNNFFKIERMKQLIQLLNDWTNKYDAGYPVVSDIEWDKNYFELTEDGFSHDHCDECFKRIEDNTEYYESDNNIICENCFNESN